jgi:hypothetical protein
MTFMGPVIIQKEIMTSLAQRSKHGSAGCHNNLLNIIGLQFWTENFRMKWQNYGEDTPLKEVTWKATLMGKLNDDVSS